MARKNRLSLSPEEIETKRKKWNTPDWRKVQEYTYINELTHSQLCWEFLRREEEYRTAWKTGHKPYEPYYLEELIDPALLGNDLRMDFTLFNTVNLGNPLPFQHIDPEKWPVMPTDILSNKKLEKLYRRYGKMVADLYEEDNVILVFSTLHPIGYQLANAEKILKEASKIADDRGLGAYRKQRINKSSPIDFNLLRILDAHAEGATQREMGKFIYRKKDYASAASEANKALKRAKRFLINM